jgi:CRISPR-associated protein Csb2
MWVEESPPDADWGPVKAGTRFRRDMSLRTPHPERLEQLERAYAEFAAGRLSRNAWPTSPWQAYARRGRSADAFGGAFGSRLVVLRRIGGDGMPGLIQASAFVRALRATVLRAADGHVRAMRWLSGHEPDGRPVQQPHVAFLPLAHVGHEHADGHLLGMAVALPRNFPADDEQAVYEALGMAMESGQMRLTAGAAGSMVLVEEDRVEAMRPSALRAVTWAGRSRRWGTVTPVVLDRLPPRRHEKDDAWVEGQVAAACEKQGMPQPVAVRVLPVSLHVGAPSCRAFVPMARKTDGVKRWHVHAGLEFADQVEGPLILGAGRYRGYGLCKPLPVERE